MVTSSTLEIRLLGQMAVCRGDLDLSRFPSRKCQGLLSFLALGGDKLHSREVLAGVFWPSGSASSARKRLRTELWQARRFLEPEAGEASLFVAGNGAVGLNPQANIWVDVKALEKCLAPFEGAPFESQGGEPTLEQCRQLEAVTHLYRGDLLEGSYYDWCLDARESLKGRFLAALERLMSRHQRRRRWGAAIDCGRTILRHEPLTESVHRALMRCYFELGDRAAALRQYRRCVALLAAELDVEPMFETSILSQQIRAHRGPLSLRPAFPIAGAGAAAAVR